MTDSDMQKLAEGNSNSNNQIPLVLSILAVLLAVIGLIIGAVSLSQNGTNYYTINSAPDGLTTGPTSNDEKIWTFAIGHEASATEYLDEVSGQIKGFDVDIVNAEFWPGTCSKLCKIAGKNCRWVDDVYTRCWDSEKGQQQRGGIGLFNGYYDACTAWLNSYVRARTFQFTDPFADGNKAGFIVKKGNPDGLDPANLNSKTIGFVDGWINDEYCLARELPGSITGDLIPAENVVHYVHREDFFDAITSGEIDAGFDGKILWSDMEDYDVVEFQDIQCFKAGRSIMTKKDNRLYEWWNPAFQTLTSSYEYRLICQDLIEQHGHLPGPNPEDICFGYKK